MQTTWIHRGVVIRAEVSSVVGIQLKVRVKGIHAMVNVENRIDTATAIVEHRLRDGELVIVVRIVAGPMDGDMRIGGGTVDLAVGNRAPFDRIEVGCTVPATVVTTFADGLGYLDKFQTVNRGRDDVTVEDLSLACRFNDIKLFARRQDQNLRSLVVGDRYVEGELANVLVVAVVAGNIMRDDGKVISLGNRVVHYLHDNLLWRVPVTRGKGEEAKSFRHGGDVADIVVEGDFDVAGRLLGQRNEVIDGPAIELARFVQPRRLLLLAGYVGVTHRGKRRGTGIGFG